MAGSIAQLRDIHDLNLGHSGDEEGKTDSEIFKIFKINCRR